jgi:hypothetical protein
VKQVTQKKTSRKSNKRKSNDKAPKFSSTLSDSQLANTPPIKKQSSKKLKTSNHFESEIILDDETSDVKSLPKSIEKKYLDLLKNGGWIYDDVSLII